MSISNRLRKWRHWFPIPTRGYRPNPIRWLLLEGNRIAVTCALLTLVFVSILVIGSAWTFEMQTLLTETDAVQTLLNTILGGIILLVSIVVSISAIVLSYDITSVGEQETRIEEATQFRREIGELMETDRSPSDPESFLAIMSGVIAERAEKLEQSVRTENAEPRNAIAEYVDSVEETMDDIDERLDAITGSDFGVLWMGLEAIHGNFIDQSRSIQVAYGSDLSDDTEARLDGLVEALELFATGKEYFKTLYYSQEISELSRTLLVISLPAILVTATTVLAIDSGLLPDVWILGLPPLLTFVAATFTISLAPFIVLTSYMLRVATVASETVSAGPFVLE